MTDDAETLVSVPADGVDLEGALAVPGDAPGLVVFAHGSGSSRKSPRNTYVAEVLRERGLGTLLFDLLTEEEDRVREARFDVGLLTDRLVAATDWVRGREATRDLPIGYFGSSTGAAAALRAAARLDDEVDAVVSRGGRVDLAADAFDAVRAPTLLIVGGDDESVIDLNREAREAIAAETDLHVVAGAGHLFEGEGELEEVADVAAGWFADRLR
jgi:pimeloyl-ACP methyl ester carboxylesterase